MAINLVVFNHHGGLVPPFSIWMRGNARLAMSLPSLDYRFQGVERLCPRVLVLAVRSLDALDAEPIAHVLVERVETYIRHSKDSPLLGAKISLAYQTIGVRHGNFFDEKTCGGVFSAKYSPSRSSVSLTSGAVFLDLPGLEGLHIGTYLMSEIIRWAQQWPDADVEQISLQAAQGTNVEERLRRNRFYEQFGIRFAYETDDRMAGHSLPTKVRDLIIGEACAAWAQNIQELRFRDWSQSALRNLCDARSDLEACKRANREAYAELSTAWRSPFLWACRQRKAMLLVFGVFLLLGIATWAPR